MGHCTHDRGKKLGQEEDDGSFGKKRKSVEKVGFHSEHCAEEETSCEGESKPETDRSPCCFGHSTLENKETNVETEISHYCGRIKQICQGCLKMIDQTLAQTEIHGQPIGVEKNCVTQKKIPQTLLFCHQSSPSIN